MRCSYGWNFSTEDNEESLEQSLLLFVAASLKLLTIAIAHVVLCQDMTELIQPERHFVSFDSVIVL